MKKTILFLFLVFIVFLGNGFSQSNQKFNVIGEVSDTTSGDLIQEGAVVVQAISADSINGTLFQEKYPISNGEFNISLDEGEYYFSYYADGYETIYEQYTYINSDTTMSIHMDKIFVYDNYITGKVVDKETQNNVLYSYLVLSGQDSAQIYFSKTEENGGYKFENIKPGTYKIGCKTYGFKKYESQQIVIEENSKIENYLIELEPSEKYSNIKIILFETLNNIKTPIKDAAVYLSNIDWLISSRTPSYVENGDTVYDGYYKSLTDNDGNAIFNDVIESEYYIEINKEGYERTDYLVQYINIDSDNIEISIELSRLPEPAYGYIRGEVKTNETNEPLTAYIEFYKLYNDSSDSIGVIEPEQYFYTSVVTNEYGEYKAELDTGRYKVRCYFYDGMYNYKYLAEDGFAANFIEEYYNDVTSIDEAEILTVEKNVELNDISFGLDYKFPTMKTVTIKGKVTDENNHPLDNAYVNFNFNYYMMYRNSITTDTDGNYEISLKVIDSYDEEIRISAVKEGYTQMFYNNKAAWYLADPIIIKKSENDTVITDINFSIKQIDQLATYSVSGVVKDTIDNPISGVYVDAHGLNTNKYYSTTTDSTGKYNFNDLVEGSYIISFYGENYAYEFYNDKKIWEEAEIIQLNSDLENIDAILNKQDYIECFDLKRNDISVSGSISDVNGNPISGASVFLSADNSNAQLSTVTDNKGLYSFGSLKQNNYTLTVSKIEYQSISEKVDLVNSTQQSLNLKLLKSITNINPINNDIPNSYKLHNNYPNPFNPSTNIKFELPENASVKLAVYNILGEEVKILVNEKLEAGSYDVKFDASNLSSGIYFYTIKTENYNLTKKMLLIK